MNSSVIGWRAHSCVPCLDSSGHRLLGDLPNPDSNRAAPFPYKRVTPRSNPVATPQKLRAGRYQPACPRIPR